MKGEETWKISIDGTEHKVRFTQVRTKFELFVDDELCGRILKTNYEDNVEKDIVINGKICQFVVYGDEPDLVVDGVMQRVEAQMRKTDRFHKWTLIGFGIAQILVGTLAGALWFGMTMAGQKVLGGYLALLGVLIFTGAGVAELLYGLKHK